MREIHAAALLICLGFVPCSWAQTSRVVLKDHPCGWKQYRNLKFGFEFQNPQKFSVVENGPDPNEQRFLAGETISGTQPPLLDSFDVLDRKGRRVLRVEMPDQKNFPVVNDKSYAWSMRACGEIGFMVIKSKQKILFAGYKTLKVLSDHTRYYCINDPFQPVIIYYHEKGGFTLPKILSSFRFVK